jgi:tRNA G46 methylase TrmB
LSYATGVPTASWTATRYRRRDTPEYAHQPPGALRKQWQPDVYLAARALARALPARRVIDVGCGNGAKLIALASGCPGVATIGIDRGANLARARARVSPPASAGTRSTGVTGIQGPTRWRADGSSP